MTNRSQFRQQITVMRAISLRVFGVVLALISIFSTLILGPRQSVQASTKSIALGAYVPFSPKVSFAPIDGYGREVGRVPAIVWSVEYWGDPKRKLFPRRILAQLRKRGVTPMINWQPSTGPSDLNDPKYSWTSIASGQDDAYVRTWAKAAKKYGYPVYVRLMHEMNGNWYAWGNRVNGNTKPADFVRAWRHVVNIFRSVGATNVGFVWCVAALGWTSADKALYPGDSYVDWTAMDGYNKNKPWITLYKRFASVYSDLAALSTRPIMIAEVASVEDPRPRGLTKAEWINQGFLQTIPHTFPRVRAVLWFDSNQGPGRDWRVDSSQASLHAYKQVVTDPYYHGAMPPPRSYKHP